MSEKLSDKMMGYLEDLSLMPPEEMSMMELNVVHGFHAPTMRALHRRGLINVREVFHPRDSIFIGSTEWTQHFVYLTDAGKAVVAAMEPVQ